MPRIDAARGVPHEVQTDELPARPRPLPRPPPASTVESHGSRPVPTHRALEVTPQAQGRTNACGTTSLATVMTYFGQPTDHQTIDAGVRHLDTFTAPDALVSYARAHGMRAELKDGASLEDLAKLVDEGVPPMVIVDPDSSQNANLHYLTVCGYDRDASGKISSLTVADSATGTRRTLSASEFEKRWSDLKLDGVSTGLNRVMITAVPADGRPITGADGVTRSASSIELPASDLRHSLESLPARAVASAVSGATAVVDAIGGFFGRLFGGRP